MIGMIWTRIWCKKHSTYKARHRPKSKIYCPTCWDLYCLACGLRVGNIDLDGDMDFIGKPKL